MTSHDGTLNEILLPRWHIKEILLPSVPFFKLDHKKYLDPMESDNSTRGTWYWKHHQGRCNNREYNETRILNCII